MNIRFSVFSLLILGIFLFPKPLVAQEIQDDEIGEPMDDLGNVSDEFQERFFEALKQKAIENYELALSALSQAEKASKNPEHKAVVYFEMGKNHALLKDYDAAEREFKKVLKIDSKQMDVQAQLYDVYYKQSDYDKAIPLVEQLIKQDEDYKEDLANLLTLTKQYDRALTLLDELDETWGESDIRNALRARIYRVTGNREGAIANIEQKIDNNPKNEKDYLNLIFLYSEQGDVNKAYETAKSLLSNNPNSELVHLALYKFYLDEGNISEGIKSMKIVFAADDIDTESKYRVLGDFILFVNEHPEYEKDLEEVVQLFSDENGAKVYEKIGDYFVAKSKKEEALGFYEKGMALQKDNYNLLKNTLLLQLDFKNFDAAAGLSEEALSIFPAQALIYLLNGVANIGLRNHKQAIESLEMGLDFLIDDPKMEHDFYEQLRIAYTETGNTKKAAESAEKASQIKMPN